MKLAICTKNNYRLQLQISNHKMKSIAIKDFRIVLCNGVVVVVVVVPAPQ